MDNYFEGYYFKLTSKDESLCFIVGYTLGENAHSFIQVFGSKFTKMHYFKFETLMCTMMRNPLYIRINNNIFTKNKIQVELENDEIVIKGTVCFSKQASLIKTRYMPSVMGPLSYVRAECVHDVVILYSKVNGAFRMRNQSIVFDDAYGYVEGDRGVSFPKAYLWLQAIEEDFSIFLSLAVVDLKYFCFKGVIALIHHGNTQYRFGSYYLATFDVLEDVNAVTVSLKQGVYHLLVEIMNYEEDMMLVAPENGGMNGVTRECVEATISMSLFKNGFCVVSKEGLKASVELKNIEDLM